MKFFFPSHLPFPGLSKECQESDKLKAADYCGLRQRPVKGANIRNNVVQPVLGAQPCN